MAIALLAVVAALQSQVAMQHQQLMMRGGYGSGPLPTREISTEEAFERRYEHCHCMKCLNRRSW